MKRKNTFILILIICLALIGCNKQNQIDTDGENYKEIHESNLSEVEELRNKIAELEVANDDLSLKLKDLINTNTTIKKLEDNIKVLELIIEKKETTIKENEVTDAPTEKELIKKVYKAAKVYQDFFFLSHLKHHDDTEKMKSEVYKLDNKMNEELEGYYLVTEDNIKNLADFISILEENYTKKAIYDFLKIYEKGNMAFLNNGSYIEYNGMLFTTLGGGIGVSPYDKVYIDEVEFQLCGMTKDGNTLIYKMVLPIAQLDQNGQVEDMKFDESFIELVRNTENEWVMDEFIIVEDDIYSEEYK